MGGKCLFGFLVIAMVAIVSVLTAYASHSPAAGQIVGHCVGWPSPHVEIWWHGSPPPGAPPPNSNSILRDVNGTGDAWLFGGGSGVWRTRINGQPANPYGPGGYPNPNYSVRDLRDNAVSAGNTYTYRVKYRPETSSSNVYAVTINAANCGGAPTPPPPPQPSPPPPGAGTIVGVCRWVSGTPQVQLTWSQYPPPGQGAANANSIQKGDSFPSDPNLYWGFLSNNPALSTHTDSSVVLNTQYQYRVKYRLDLPSLNIYNIYVSAENCGGPVPPAGPLIITPTFQTIPPNVTAFLTASGGTGTYAWSVGDGTVTGSGSLIGVTYTNASTQPVTKTVAVTSGAQTATATVQVNGVETLQDSIDLTAPGSRRIIINDDDPVTPYFDVGLTLAHGFPTVASDSIEVQLSNTLEDVGTAALQPYRESIPWNICDSQGYCDEGPYTVFAIFTAPGNIQSPIVLDNILYIQPTVFPPPSVEINGGDAATDDRVVALSLEHGLGAVPVDEIGMQIANRADLVSTADSVAFTPALVGWDLCSGLGSTCANGTKTVFVRYCARGQCAAARDLIQLSSAWPDWGIRINEDAPSTTTAAVQLRLNPFFDRPGTEMFIGNLADLSDATTRSFTALVPWDLCANRATPCTPDTYTVYVRYVNTVDLSFPESESPKYEDIIALVGAPAPAAILLDDGAPVTTDRIVSVRFTNPFSTATGVSLRAVNENSLSRRDRDLIATEFGGGIESQPGSTRPLVSSDQAQHQSPQVGKSELESGTVRPYTDLIGAWDLCDATAACRFGTYRVYAQFYRTPTTAGAAGTLAAVGDEVSWVYFDTIRYAAGTTPTPPPGCFYQQIQCFTTPCDPVLVCPSVTPTPTGTGGPTPSGGPGPTPCTGFLCILPEFFDAFAGAEPVLGPLALVSALVVALSALLTLLPLIGPGLISFAGQWLLGAMGLLPARKKTWGTIYDSVTKRPIAYAKVQLLDRNRRALETRIADKDGRYGFLTTPESLQAQNTQIYILPTAPGYAFPSHAAPTIDLFVYNNLYRGDLITVSDSALINFDVPMDPTKHQAPVLFRASPSIAMGAAVAAMADAGFWLGLIIVPLNFLVNPNPFTFGTLCLFLGTASLRLFGISEHPFGTVSDSQTGHAMPYALITLNDRTGKRAAFAVSDEQGRYFMVVERGHYELIAFTPATIQPTRQSRQAIEVKKGWVTRSIKL